MSSKPLILMTFASNDDLDGIAEETLNVYNAVKDNPIVSVEKIENVEIDSLAESIIRHRDGLFMFHFGGHANQKEIVLDGFYGLDVTRLSRLLLPMENHDVQIMFLNGCLSYGLVGQLTAKGVKAIIATNKKIYDDESIKFSKFFYKLFFEENYSLQKAFETASATVGGTNAHPVIVNPGESAKMPSSWSLFIDSRHKEVLDWTLLDFVEKIKNKDTAAPSTNITRQINMGNNSTYNENNY